MSEENEPGGEEAAKEALAKRRAEMAGKLADGEAGRESPLLWDQSSGKPRPKMNIWQKLAWVQKHLVVPKERGKGHDEHAKVEYAFRNSSDILSRAKPLCFAVDAMVIPETEPTVFAPDAKAEIVTVRKPYDENKDVPTVAIFGGPWRLLLAKATFIDIETGEQVVCRSSAEQDYWRKGQAEPEKRSGSTDSYATKYALCHLFAIDDNKDADSLSSDGTIGNKPEDPPW